ncbi:hypothetical protein AMATHDRAFT_52195 [Amanita thiersii Skay4041]|uniref:Uncharacterized protein n=1 Tax=Amanita thiersii Skay4041 TaxID=703135 RepID=A0A2A9P0F9_9AGAR|nr:hypothetical protein AMATHDRAFT_52195 [Amanita thiersii Skay4041]
MPAILNDYEVLLVLRNDTQSCAAIQPQRDYGQDTNTLVIMYPEDSITLVLDSGSVYQYSVKVGSKVAQVTVQSWRDVRCNVSHLLSLNYPRGAGITVQQVWRDYRCFCA